MLSPQNYTEQCSLSKKTKNAVSKATPHNAAQVANAATKYEQPIYEAYSVAVYTT